MYSVRQSIITSPSEQGFNLRPESLRPTQHTAYSVLLLYCTTRRQTHTLRRTYICNYSVHDNNSFYYLAITTVRSMYCCLMIFFSGLDPDPPNLAYLTPSVFEIIPILPYRIRSPVQDFVAVCTPLYISSTGPFSLQFRRIVHTIS